MSRNRPNLLILMALVTAPAWSAGAGPADYLYSLSDFSGTVPYGNVAMHVDDHHGETYVLFQNDIRVFNETGMEVYRFGQDERLGMVRDLAVRADGSIWVLSNDLADATRPRFFLTRCDYRGRPGQTVEVRGLPLGLEDFLAQSLEISDERVLLVEADRMRIVETDLEGRFVALHDLADTLGIPPEKRNATVINGLAVDRHGNLVFTIATMFKVFVVSPEGDVTAFGRPGSSPGKFGVIAGVAVDRHGHYVVADRQRSVVMVFDERFEFVGEFGGYGEARDSLTRPVGVAVDDDGRLYVTQMRDRGVSVFLLDCAGSDRRSPADTSDQLSNTGKGGDGPEGSASADVRVLSKTDETEIPTLLRRRFARHPAATMVIASLGQTKTGPEAVEGGGR